MGRYIRVAGYITTEIGTILNTMTQNMNSKVKTMTQNMNSENNLPFHAFPENSMMIIYSLRHLKTKTIQLGETDILIVQ